MADTWTGTDRYDTAGPPNGCEGECEGTGVIPVDDDEADPTLRLLYQAARKLAPPAAVCQFVPCPDCNPGGCSVLLAKARAAEVASQAMATDAQRRPLTAAARPWPLAALAALLALLWLALALLGTAGCGGETCTEPDWTAAPEAPADCPAVPSCIHTARLRAACGWGAERPWTPADVCRQAIEVEPRYIGGCDPTADCCEAAEYQGRVAD